MRQNWLDLGFKEEEYENESAVFPGPITLQYAATLIVVSNYGDGGCPDKEEYGAEIHICPCTPEQAGDEGYRDQLYRTDNKSILGLRFPSEKKALDWITTLIQFAK